jgi:hypothetical protein
MAIFAARYHEARGDGEAARAQYVRLVTDVAPGLLEVRARGSVFYGGGYNWILSPLNSTLHTR